MYLARSSKEMQMNPDVCGQSNTELYAGMQSCIEMMMWQACHLISWWCGKLIISEPDSTGSCPITCVASDLSRTRQKYHCMVRCIIGLQQAHSCHDHTMGNVACAWFVPNLSGAWVVSAFTDSGFLWLCECKEYWGSGGRLAERKGWGQGLRCPDWQPLW